VFKAAGDRSAREIVEVIEAAGGHINAATGHDRTSFQVRALKGGLELAMAVVADLVLRPRLAAADLAKEKRVVAQEIAEAADVPDDLVFELAGALAYAGHPLGRPILGTRASVGRAKPRALEAFRAALYAPDRIVIVAAGAVDEDELLALAERWFAGAAAAEPAGRPPSAAFAGGTKALARPLEQAHLVMLLPAVGYADPDHYAFRLFTEILGGGMSSRLFQAVRERLGLAYAIDAYLEAHADVGVLGVYAGASAAKAGKAASVAAREFRALCASVEAAELARAKAQLKGSLFMARESAAARAEQAAAQLLTYGRLIPTSETAAAIDAVQPADIVRVGARALESGRSACALLGPKSALAAADGFHAALFGAA
jgi:predicted Zn-dependent peptidase